MNKYFLKPMINYVIPIYCLFTVMPMAFLAFSIVWWFLSKTFSIKELLVVYRPFFYLKSLCEIALIAYCMLFVYVAADAMAKGQWGAGL